MYDKLERLAHLNLPALSTRERGGRHSNRAKLRGSLSPVPLAAVVKDTAPKTRA